MDYTLSLIVCFGLFLLTPLTAGKSEFECNANQKSQQSYLQWANTLPILVEQDKAGEQKF